MKKKIAVIGLGILGRNLAVFLAERGAEVIAIDSNMEPVDEIKDKVTLAVQLNSTNEKALAALDISDVDAAVVCIGDNFQANLLTTVLLKKMGVKRVITRASNPLERSILQEIGADELVYPEEDLAKELAVRLTAVSIEDLLSLGVNLAAAKIRPPHSICGKTLAELHLRKTYGINIAAIYNSEDEEATENPFPTPEHVIAENEMLLVIGRKEDLIRFAELQ
ncbi:MAG TPA: TrkA family potassium uptake protein [bacterium]|nr:TrkA family potassium uptake protein [Candidatus Omnitrophota bacterium]HOL92807.1 TrkA family potassium uptake protein [bacterium]HPP00371.1 TrkA family potassium uptake protein [bacterium]HXK92993.1 TrkA family potassium uptake protein [bacterium]